MCRASPCVCLELPRNPRWSAPFLLTTHPLRLASPISLTCSFTSFWNVLPRTPGCGMGLGRAWVNGICLPPPSAISHTQKGSHIIQRHSTPPPPPPPCTTGRKCLGSGYHGDGSCCLDHSGLPDTDRSLQAWQPGTLQASSQAAGAGAALLSPLGVWHCWSYPGALGNKMPLWEPRSYSGSDRPGLNPTSAPWGSVTLNESPWRALNVLN